MGRRRPGVGDSAVIDVLGLGAQLIDEASPVYRGLQHVLPSGHARARDVFKAATLPGLGGLTGAVDAAGSCRPAEAPSCFWGCSIRRGGRPDRCGQIEIPTPVFAMALRSERSAGSRGEQP